MTLKAVVEWSLYLVVVPQPSLMNKTMTLPESTEEAAFPLSSSSFSISRSSELGDAGSLIEESSCHGGSYSIGEYCVFAFGEWQTPPSLWVLWLPLSMPHCRNERVLCVKWFSYFSRKKKYH